jgi:hypothetical protein
LLLLLLVVVVVVVVVVVAAAAGHDVSGAVVWYVVRNLTTHNATH